MEAIETIQIIKGSKTENRQSLKFKTIEDIK